MLLAGAGWSAYSFGQEAYLGFRLNHQVAQLRSQNATLQEQNAGYHRDIGVLNSGAGAEEQARINGYARKGEQLYLVGQPPAASIPAPKLKPMGHARASGPIASFRRWVAALLPR
ncbi:MAG: FtsB family cell division protein [Candidatus Dormibacteraceae bacterium]